MPIPPAIKTQPANRTVNLGEAAQFTVKATGTAPLDYQWRKNGSDIAGATASSYTTPPAVADDNDSEFLVVVSNNAGIVISKTRTLTVNLPPTITTQPQNKSVKAGATARFKVVAIGKSPLTYQWTKNGVDIDGATKSFYVSPPTTMADNGTLFAVSVTNNFGRVVSNEATLTVR
jgi:Ig-like domain-containing protein/immunoglobulin I-set domain protein